MSAYKDELTGAGNRLSFYKHLQYSLHHASQRESRTVLIFIGLDRFKYHNESLGHEVADLLLKRTAERIQSTLSQQEIFSRLGGDEFAIVINDVGEIQEVERLAEKIVEKISEIFRINDEEICLTASLGIASYPECGDDPSELIRSTNSAMQYAKNTGRNKYKLYQVEESEASKHRCELENSLRSALKEDQFFVNYQPKIDIKSRSITGLEALIRWDHPTFGLVNPADFIPLAEESGMICDIGSWVLYQSCLQNAAWQRAGLNPVSVSVNLSTHQLNGKDLVDNVIYILNDTQLDPKFLELEITESVIMSDPERMIEVLKELHTMGISIAVDDFGTGYSSLNYLKVLPLDTLKADRSFIKDLHESNSDAVIVKSIINLAHNLDLLVVAEGVENLSQLDFLRNHHCDQMQGFYVSRPLPTDQTTQVLTYAS